MRYFKDIGAMDRLVTLRYNSLNVADRFDNVDTLTATTIEVNAALSWNNKKEKTEQTRETQDQYLYVIIRYTEIDIKTNTVVFEDKEYNIVDIEPIGRQRYLKLTLQRYE